MTDTEREMRDLVLSTLAKGALVELRTIIDQCHDKDTARPIYTELRRLAYEIAKRHNFETQRDARNQAILAIKPAIFPAQL
jgi:hypothetical protein